MAAKNCINYINMFAKVPASFQNGTEYRGHVKLMRDSFPGTTNLAAVNATLPASLAQTAYAGGDVLTLGKLPAGAFIVDTLSLNGDSPTFNVTPGSTLAVETTITMTLGATPTLANDVIGMVMFVLPI